MHGLVFIDFSDMLGPKEGLFLDIRFEMHDLVGLRSAWTVNLSDGLCFLEDSIWREGLNLHVDPCMTV